MGHPDRVLVRPPEGPRTAEHGDLSLEADISVCHNRDLDVWKLLHSLMRLSLPWAMEFPGRLKPPSGQSGLGADAMRFSSIKILLTLDRRRTKARNPCEDDDMDKFDSLFNDISMIFKGKKFKQQCGKDRLVLICWALFNRHAPERSKMSRWVLPAPEHPICLPAEKLEMALYNLVVLDMKRADTAHAGCDGRAFFDCIETMLYEQKQAYQALIVHQHALQACVLDGSVSPIVDRSIEANILAIEGMRMHLSSIVSLIEAHVGRAPAVKGRWNVFGKLRAFLWGRFTTVAIDDPSLEMLKKNARREICALQRVSPALAAHTRLQSRQTRNGIKRVCDEAGPGPEKREMTSKLAISPAHLNDPERRVAQMKRMLCQYETTYGNVIAAVEAVNKLVGSERARRGDDVFRARRGLRSLGWKKSEPQKTCVVEAAKDEIYSLEWREKHEI